MGLVAGIDMATAHVRAQALDESGVIRAECVKPLPAPLAPRPGYREQNAGSWWPAVVWVLRQLISELASRSDEIAAICVSSTSGTVVALDGSLEPLGPALTYADQRGVEQAGAAHDADRERWERLSLQIQPSFGLPKLGWMMTRAPYRDRIAHLVHASDLVNARLLGHLPPTDYSHALKSGFDPQLGEWSAKALDRLAVPVEFLPEVLSPGTSAGSIAAVAAAQTGLPAGCRVVLGMTDSCAAQLAAGAGSPGNFVSVLGTTLVLKGASRVLIRDPAGVVYSHRHPGGWWLPGGASSTGAGCLAAHFGGRDLANLDERAKMRGPSTVVSYPLIGTGERFPFVDPTASGFTLGQPEDEVDRYRALLEGVAFVERLGFEQLESMGAGPVETVVVTGGGSRSPAWNRIRATVLGRSLKVRIDATTARGAAMLAAAGTLHADLATATEAMAPAGSAADPNPQEAEMLDTSYERLRAEMHRRGWVP